MIKLTSSLPITIIALVLSIGIASCDKNDSDATSSDKVELLSFGPTGAKHGDTIRFIGHNLNQVTAIEFTGGAAAAVKQSDFKQQTSDLIKVVVPQAAEKGYVTLKTPQGDIVTKTQFNLDVLTTITSMTAQARPGENITINGTYLNWVDRITFNRDKLVQTFVTKTFNQLVVKIPDDAQTGPLILHYTGTDSADIQTVDTLKVKLPLITSLSPNPVKPLTNVTITGTDLDLTKKVIFNGAAAVTTFVSQTATQLVVKVPETAKKAKLTLEAASGVQTTSANDLDIVLPVITSFTPSPINLGASLTINGTDLDLVKKVIFSGVAPAVTTFTSQSATQIVLNVPAGSRKGKIKLEAASTVQTTSANDLDVILPAITSFTPSPVTPGNNLTINGTKLDMVTAVAFVNASAVTTFVSQTPTQIVVTVPVGVLRGKITLRISNPTDTIQSADILEISGAAPPPVVALPFYNDAVTANWNGWLGGGWGGTKDLANTTPVREGSKSCTINYVGGWGSPLQLGGANINMSSYTTFKISIFGGVGTAGKKVNIVFNGNNTVGNGIPAGSINSVSNYTITLGPEGQWADYAIPFASFSAGTSTTKLEEIWVQEYNGTGGFIIYIDAMGLN